MSNDDIVAHDILRTADEHLSDYKILVDYFIQVRKYSIDDAHREVDAIMRYIRLAG